MSSKAANRMSLIASLAQWNDLVCSAQIYQVSPYKACVDFSYKVRWQEGGKQKDLPIVTADQRKAAIDHFLLMKTHLRMYIDTTFSEE